MFQSLKFQKKTTLLSSLGFEVDTIGLYVKKHSKKQVWKNNLRFNVPDAENLKNWNVFFWLM